MTSKKGRALAATTLMATAFVFAGCPTGSSKPKEHAGDHDDHDGHDDDDHDDHDDDDHDDDPEG